MTCYAFSPPAAVVSPLLSTAMSAWVTSIVVGRDLVPRISLPSVQALLRDAVGEASSCKSHKATVMGWNPFAATAWKKMTREERYRGLKNGSVRSGEEVGQDGNTTHGLG